MRLMCVLTFILLLGCAAPVVQRYKVIRPSEYLTEERRVELIMELRSLAGIRVGGKLWTGEYPHDTYVGLLMAIILDSVEVRDLK